MHRVPHMISSSAGILLWRGKYHCQKRKIPRKNDAKKDADKKPDKTTAKVTKVEGEVIVVEGRPEKPVEVTTEWRLSEVPQVEGAFVALNPKDGAILAPWRAASIFAKQV
ncbi:MAG: hypothetical protein R3E08_11605 [Thiotrichaceae bacterium]